MQPTQTQRKPRRPIAGLLACLIAAAVMLGAAPSLPRAQAIEIPGVPADQTVETLRIPLRDGQLEFGHLMGSLVERVGIDGSLIRGKINWRFDVAGTIGKARLSMLKLIVRRYMTMAVQPNELVITIDRLQLRRDEKKLRGKFRSLVEGWFPEDAAAAALGYGVVVHRRGHAPLALADAQLPKRNVVMLVHGLDDPGRLWADLRPRLVDAGYTVCEMTYPNDQPIDTSAKTLADHLATMRARGARRVAIVAHSMGGLVARETLTHERYYAGQGAGHSTYPDVHRLVMVGTPNHGSQAARLDMISEMREQTVRLFSGDGLLFGSVFDGAGEARVDLIPRSEFLLRLNARPHPDDVAMTIIAGKASPVSDDKIDKMRRMVNGRFPKQAKHMDTVAETMKSLSQGVGDGVVPVKSTKLVGVDDFHLVDGNHMSMIRNYPIGHAKTRVPPAAPIILERLSADR